MMPLASKPFSLNPACIFILVALLGTNLQAQNWFPAGATWTYTYQSVASQKDHQARIGVVSQLVEDERIISTIDILSDNGSEFALCQPISLPLYVYVSNDSVYYATQADSSYRLALVTNAQTGDKWHIATHTLEGIDSNLVIVENVEAINIEGTDLKKWKYKSIVAGASEGIKTEIDAEGLEYAGSLYSLLFPVGTISGCNAITNIQLWCYSDARINYVSPDAEGCAVDFKPIGAWSPLLIYPNPNQNKVYFKFNGPAPAVQIYDEQGWTPVMDRTPDLQKRQMELAPVSFGVFMTGF
jgi:hypothetical protein